LDPDRTDLTAVEPELLVAAAASHWPVASSEASHWPVNADSVVTSQSAIVLVTAGTPSLVQTSDLSAKLNARYARALDRKS